MFEQPNIKIEKDSNINLHIIGYSDQGESIIFSIDDKFVGIIDSYKGNDFITKKILEEQYGSRIDFICWTHPDWDHTKGLSDLISMANENTKFIMPTGISPKEILNMIGYPENSYSQEYKKIYEYIDEQVKSECFAEVNEHSLLYRFYLLFLDERYEVSIETFSPIGRLTRDIGKHQIENILHQESIENKSDDLLNFLKSENGRMNNILSVGIYITISDESNNIIKTICLTSDLDDLTIVEMSKANRSKYFERNTFIKIPHHGSDNASLLVDEIEFFQHAATTCYKPNWKHGLPRNSIIEKYIRKNGKVAYTNFKAEGSYGIANYSIPITTYNKLNNEIRFLAESACDIFN